MSGNNDTIDFSRNQFESPESIREEFDSIESSRTQFVIDDVTDVMIDKLAEFHHNDVRSESVRNSVRFRYRWCNKDRSLPKQIVRSLEEIKEEVKTVNNRLDEFGNRLDELEQTAAESPGQDLDRRRLKREIRGALPKTSGRRIDDVAEELGHGIRDVRDVVQELEDDGIVTRTTENEEQPRFRLL